MEFFGDNGGMINENGTEGTCLKPIGELARAIEAMPFEDWARFVVELSKKETEKTIDKPVVIGEND